MKTRFVAMGIFIIAVGIFFNIINTEDAQACHDCSSQTAKCGKADGSVFPTTPKKKQLCSNGRPSVVLGNGPWYWTCNSGDCGNIVHCSADKTPDPVCGASDGEMFETAPESELCAVGRESSVEGDGPWSWTCKTSRKNIVECSADKKEESDEPMCGSADGGKFETAPKLDLCDVGDATTVTGTGPWNWTCMLDEQRVSCKASKTTEPVDPEEPEEEEDDDDCDGAIGNTVWNDRNQNGMQDEGEEGISGVKVRVYHGNSVEKDYTSSQGRYKIKDLCEGQYRIAVAADTIPAGCYQTYDKDGELDNKIKTSIESDEYYRKADFGYHCPSKAIGGGMSPNTGPGMIALLTSFFVAVFGTAYWYTKKQI